MNTQLKALSIRQPFASLVVSGMKKLEVRSKQTTFRGRLLICSSLTLHDGLMINPLNQEQVTCLQYVWDSCKIPLLFGFGIGFVDLVGCRPMVVEDETLSLVPFQENHFVWELANPITIDAFKVKGQLGIFNVDLKT